MVGMSPSAKGRSVGYRSILAFALRQPRILNPPLEIAVITLVVGLASMAINIEGGGGYDLTLHV